MTESGFRRKHSWIVQQLLTPVDFINPFGNILMELGDDARNTIKKVFEPEYMGAAEFEWGALPKSLARMYEDNDLIIETLPLFENTMEQIEPPIQIIYVGNKNKAIDRLFSINKIYEESKQNFGTKSAMKEVSKNDFGSFYQTINKIQTDLPGRFNKRLKGWYDLMLDYAVFLDDEKGRIMSKSFYNALTEGE